MNRHDQWLLRQVVGLTAPRWLDLSLRLVTHAGGAAATSGACALLLLAPDTRAVGVAATLANLLSHLAVQVIKRLVVRPRPTIASPEWTPLTVLPDHYSFPSGHSCAAMAVSLSMALSWPVAGAVALAVAMAVGASRVYLRVHYVTDVLVGQAIGICGALAAHRILA